MKQSLKLHEDIHLTSKDFKLEWFSGQGAGGQHRNKHQNCCRITHIESGITVTGTSSRSRVDNQREAFTTLAWKVIEWYESQSKTQLEISDEVIRSYHAVRNEVLDKSSGHRQSYKETVVAGDLGKMIEARINAIRKI